jgi:tol-pal system protein YbgF
MTRLISVRVLTIASVGVGSLLIPGSTFAASREQQEMQRDIAQLQDQVRTLQSGFDQKMAALQTLVQQAVDAGNKANTSVSVLSAGVAQAIDRELKDRLAPVAGLSAKVDNVGNDMSDVRNSMADVNTQLNRVQQQLADVNNAIKVIQAPPAAPPPSNTNPDGSGAQPGSLGARSQPPAPAKTLFDNAMSDYSGGKSDLAISEFTDFVRFYPDDPNAPTAQFYIGQVHLGQGKFDQAVQDFDAVLERFPEGKMTPDAYFMKGMSLKQSGHREAGATEFRNLIKNYPRSDRASQAAEQLRAMGLSATAPTAAARRSTKK